MSFNRSKTQHFSVSCIQIAKWGREHI